MDIHEVVVALQIIRLQATVLVLQCRAPFEAVLYPMCTELWDVVPEPSRQCRTEGDMRDRDACRMLGASRRFSRGGSSLD